MIAHRMIPYTKKKKTKTKKRKKKLQNKKTSDVSIQVICEY